MFPLGCSFLARYYYCVRNTVGASRSVSKAQQGRVGPSRPPHAACDPLLCPGPGPMRAALRTSCRARRPPHAPGPCVSLRPSPCPSCRRAAEGVQVDQDVLRGRPGLAVLQPPQQGRRGALHPEDRVQGGDHRPQRLPVCPRCAGSRGRGAP